MIKYPKSIFQTLSDKLSDETKLLIFDFFRKTKLVVIQASFKAIKDINQNTYDLVDKVIEEKSKKCVVEIGEFKHGEEGKAK